MGVVEEEEEEERKVACFFFSADFARPSPLLLPPEKPQLPVSAK